MPLYYSSFLGGGGGAEPGGGGGGLPAYNTATARYWRLGIRQSWGGNNGACAELSFFDDEGNEIVPSGGTELSGGDLGGFPASNAFDGNDSSFWVSNNNIGNSDAIGNYIGYDFGASNEQTISGVRYRSRADSFGTNNAPRFAVLQYSDNGSDWTTLFEIIVVTAFGTSGEDRDWIDANRYSGGHRYWRLDVTETQAGGRFSLQQASLHVGGATGTDIVTAAGVETIFGYDSAAAFSEAFRDVKAMDQSQGTRYAANAADGTGRLIWDFGPANAPNVTDFTLISADESFGDDEAPSDFTFEYSDNGVDWTVAKTVSGESGWSPNETRVYTI